MRGGLRPTALLVLGAVSAFWLLAPRMHRHADSQWQPAGLGLRDENAGAWSLIGTARSVFAGGSAEAQDIRENGLGAKVDGGGQPGLRFSRITIVPGKVARFTGDAVPGTRVSVSINGTLAGTAAAGADGTWAMTVPALGVGDHRVVLARVDAPAGVVPTGDGQELRVAIPDSARATEIVAFEDQDRSAPKAAGEADGAAEARLRDQAERLAREASREFDDFSRRQQQDSVRKKIAQQDAAGDGGDTGNDGVVGGRDAGSSGPVSEWLSRSSRDYFDYVVPELARKGPRDPAKRSVQSIPPPERRGDLPAGDAKRRPLPDLNTLLTRAQDWLREANRTYNDVIVRDLSRRSQPTLAREEPKVAVEVQSQVAIERRADGVDIAAEERARRAGLREALDQQAMDVARKAVAERQEAERREEVERKRRLDEILAERDGEQRRAEATSRAERARLEEQRQAFERSLAEQELSAMKARRAEQARKQEENRELAEARKQEDLLAKLDADRRRAEDKRQREDAERQAERAKLVRAETERVAREAVERKRLAAEQDRQQRADVERRVARQEQDARGRQDARVAAVFERAQRIGELADEAGFGKRRGAKQRGGTAAPDTPAVARAISHPDRKSAAALRFGFNDDVERRRDRRLADQADRADTVARLARDAGFGQRRGWRSAADVPLPADPAVRREALRYASQLGGAPQGGTLKGDRDRVGEAVGGQEQVAQRGRLAGWRGRAEPFGGTGCKDRRAGVSISLPGTYVVARGDTLWHISRRHYRRGLLYRRIYKANRRTIRNPHWIYPCQRFWLPQR